MIAAGGPAPVRPCVTRSRCMPRITVLGAGVCGLAAAMLLARDGHDVTVLERDPAPAPDTLDEALTSWERGGVSQFRQAHYVHPRGREVLDECLPDVRVALAAAGAFEFDVLGAMPPTITDRTPRPGDERFATITARRPVDRVGPRARGAGGARRRGPPRRRRRGAHRAVVRRDAARHRRAHRPRRRAARRPRRRRRRPPLAAAPLPRGRRRPPAARAGRGLRLHLLHAVLPLARREAARVPRRARSRRCPRSRS